MTTDFAKRLKEARAHAGLTQEQLAEQADMSQSAIGDLESKRHGSRRTATLASICGVSALWLESGEGLMSADAAALQVQLPQGMRRYPVLSPSQASARSGSADAAEEAESLGMEIASDSASAQAFFIQLDDLSMSPDFRPGDCVLIDPQVSARPGDYVLAGNGALQALFRKYRLRGVNAGGEEVFELVPLNEDYPVVAGGQQGLVVWGVMVEWVRRGRGR